MDLKITQGEFRQAFAAAALVALDRRGRMNSTVSAYSRTVSLRRKLASSVVGFADEEKDVSQPHAGLARLRYRKLIV